MLFKPKNLLINITILAGIPFLLYQLAYTKSTSVNTPSNPLSKKIASGVDYSSQWTRQQNKKARDKKECLDHFKHVTHVHPKYYTHDLEFDHAYSVLERENLIVRLQWEEDKSHKYVPGQRMPQIPSSIGCKYVKVNHQYNAGEAVNLRHCCSLNPNPVEHRIENGKIIEYTRYTGIARNELAIPVQGPGPLNVSRLKR